MKLPALTPAARTRIYAIACAAVPILVAAGWIAGDQAALWLTLAAAILGLGAAGTATAYRPTVVPTPTETAAKAADDLVSLVRAEAPHEQLAEAATWLEATLRP